MLVPCKVSSFSIEPSLCGGYYVHACSYVCVLFFVYLFGTESHSAPTLARTTYPRLPLNLWQSSCLIFPSIGITGMSHHAHIIFDFLCFLTAVQ